MRKLPGAKGGVPYVTMAGGVCVYPRGVVLTCLHAVEDFVQHIGPYDIDEAVDVHKRGEPLPSGELESLYFGFLHDYLGEILHQPADAPRRGLFGVDRVRNGP